VRLLDADLDNLRAALTWTFMSGALTTFLRLAAAMQHFWGLTGRIAEGREWLDRAVTACGPAPLPLRAAVLREASWFARHLGEFDRAEALGNHALALSREDGDPTGIAHALTSLGWIAEVQGRFAQARRFHEEALEVGRHLEDRSWTAWSMRNVGMQAFRLGEIEVAERWLTEALALFRQQGLRFGAAHALTNLAELALARGDRARAAALWQEMLEMPWNARDLPRSLNELAKIAAAAKQERWAARLLGAGESLRERLGFGLLPREVAGFERTAADIRAVLGQEAFAAAWTEGRSLSPEEARTEAVRVANAIAASTERNSSPDDADHGLTPRELEIMRLVAEGHSDREIAETLFIGTATVRTHLTSSYGKLGVGSRTAAVAAARRLGIL
jgi:non-specific serine/threonine protein kinase